MRLAGEEERVFLGGAAQVLNGAVFLQQRDEAAAVANSALSDIVSQSASGGKKRAFRLMQVTRTIAAASYSIKHRGAAGCGAAAAADAAAAGARSARRMMQ